MTDNNEPQPRSSDESVKDWLSEADEPPHAQQQEDSEESSNTSPSSDGSSDARSSASRSSGPEDHENVADTRGATAPSVPTPTDINYRWLSMWVTFLGFCSVVICLLLATSAVFAAALTGTLALFVQIGWFAAAFLTLSITLGVISFLLGVAQDYYAT